MPRNIPAILAITALMTLSSWAEQVEVTPYTQTTHPGLNEVSGITFSSHPDVFWVHNDSGDEARIFAIDENGQVIVPPYLNDRYETSDQWPGFHIDAAWNYDWEDLTQANGVLYLADLGNNGNSRRDLGVYVLNEPNPLGVHRARVTKFLPIRYPDQQSFPAEKWHFDCEAVFADRGRLYFLTKHRKPNEIISFERGTKLYRLDTQFTDRENVLVPVASRDDIAMPTGADLSPDGSRLAVTTYTKVWLFERPAAGDNWLSGRASTVTIPREQAKFLEAVTWRDNDTLILANENRDLFRLPVSQFRPAN